MAKDKWVEHAADFKSHEELEEELDEDGESIEEVEAAHFKED